jgi:hypothetical protein
MPHQVGHGARITVWSREVQLGSVIGDGRQEERHDGDPEDVG